MPLVMLADELSVVTTKPFSVQGPVGELAVGKIGRRGNFHALREYRVGDDPRDIHWRSAARRQRLMVREHEVEAVPQVTLLLDNSLPAELLRDDTAQQQLERVISWGASLGTFYLEHGYALRLCTRGPGPALPLLWSPNSLGRLLTTLALLKVVSPDVPFQPLPPLPALGGGPLMPPCQGERSDCLMIVRPGAPLARESAFCHVVEAA